MEKRALLAVILSIAVFYGFSILFPAPKTVKPANQSAPAVQTSPSVTTAPVSPAATAAPVPAAPGEAQVRDVAVETDMFTAVLSTKGAGITSLTLKKYSEEAGPGGHPVTLVGPSDGPTALLSASGAGIGPTTVYSSPETKVAVAADGSRDVVFSYRSPSGVIAVRTFRFTGKGYGIGIIDELRNESGSPVATPVRTLLSYRDPEKKVGRFEGAGPVAFAGGKFITDVPKGDKKEISLNQVEWAGFADKYFLQALVVTGTTGMSRLEKAADGRFVQAIESAPVTVAPGTTVKVEGSLYFGPKDLDILKAHGKNLERSLYLGWFEAIAKPLLHSLKFFYRYTHNYGFAIIIITVILKVLFFPLTYKSYKSMKEMQKIQPLMNKIRDKYKNDRDAMNREVMKLYQDHKVNPLGGCFPMLIQIPVFFALYKALMFSIELRHAPFILWINDLAGKDPYYVTPVIMGITMFIQQKMTPTNMDPMQAKMMLALPVVFTFMFLNFPSGLVLYWLVNNVLTIGQQWYINRQLAES